MRLIVFLIFSIFSSNAIDFSIFPKLNGEIRKLECNFTNIETFLDQNEEFYVCNVKTGFKYTIARLNGINGTHMDGKNNLNVQILIIENVQFAMLPSGIGEVFPDLVGLEISGADLQQLMSDNIATLTKLKYLIITKNKIRFLGHDLFSNNVELQYIDLRDNLIMFIHQDAFRSVESQIQILLLGEVTCNIGGHEVAKNNTEVVELIEELKNSFCSQIFMLQRVYVDSVIYFVEEMEKLDDEIETTLTPEPCLTTTEIELPDTSTTESFDSTTYLTTCYCLETDCTTTITTEFPCDTKELEDQITNLTNNVEILTFNLTTCDDYLTDLKVVNEDLKEELFEERNPVNTTCRFKETDNGYTCAGNKIEITKENQKIEWFGQHLKNYSNENVETFYLKSQNVLFLPLEVGKNFENLENFIVEFSGVKSLKKNDFEALENLKKLSLANNEISTISRGTFDDLTKLMYLNLNNNSLTVLPSKVFSELLVLNYLNLSNNKISQLRYDLISPSLSITEFYAQNNALSSVDVLFIWRLKNATIIDFGGNKCNKKFDAGNNQTFSSFFNFILKECS